MWVWPRVAVAVVAVAVVNSAVEKDLAKLEVSTSLGMGRGRRVQFPTDTTPSKRPCTNTAADFVALARTRNSALLLLQISAPHRIVLFSFVS